jgi:hypothetical protein
MKAAISRLTTGGCLVFASLGAISSNALSLGAMLPPGVYFQSTATCIAEQNGVYYVDGYADRGSDLLPEAFLWVGTIPARGAASLLAFAAVYAARRRR